MRDCQRHGVYPPLGAVLLVALVFVACGGSGPVWAQTHAAGTSPTGAVDWQLVLDGEPVGWPDGQPDGSVDSVRTVGQRVLEHLRSKGYYYATLDSVTVDSSARASLVRLNVHRGPRVRIETLSIEGAEAVPASELRALMETEEGGYLEVEQLEADIESLLDQYEAAGRPLVQIRVGETHLTTESDPALRVTLHVEEGPELRLEGIDVPEGARTSPELLARLADLEVGAPLHDYDPEAIRRTLQQRDYFQHVGAPALRVGADGGAVLEVPVEEASPGAFDFALGYLPPSPSRESGQVVGRGHLLLKHLFGGGRTAEFTLDRRPGRSSIFDVSLTDPYLFGLPLRVATAFRGEQRDSTYGERTYRLETGYRLGRGLELTGSVSRDVVRPGPAGQRLRRGRQRIPRSTTLFYGLGLRYEAVDHPQNPRRGISIDVQISQGRKRRRVQRIVANGDTVRATNSFRQKQMTGRVRGYIPLFQRQVIAVGGEGALLRSRTYDRSDLFRLGGARSLRGYDEDRFLGNVVGRGFVEYRLQLDPASYGFAFGEIGYASRPSVGAAEAAEGWHPSYGLGIRFQTAIGRISTTYALNPDVGRPSNGRIHLGLSVEL